MLKDYIFPKEYFKFKIIQQAICFMLEGGMLWVCFFTNGRKFWVCWNVCFCCSGVFIRGSHVWVVAWKFYVVPDPRISSHNCRCLVTQTISLGILHKPSFKLQMEVRRDAAAKFSSDSIFSHIWHPAYIHAYLVIEAGSLNASKELIRISSPNPTCHLQSLIRDIFSKDKRLLSSTFEFSRQKQLQR